MPTESGDPDEILTDAELTALALAADPHEPIAEGAVPIGIHLAQLGSALPGWYMPPMRSTRRSPWRTGIIIFIVVSFLLIEALGLCVTYGQLVAA